MVKPLGMGLWRHSPQTLYTYAVKQDYAKGEIVLDRFRRKKHLAKAETYRKSGEIAIDMSGLDQKSRKNIIKAFEDIEKEKKRSS